ncbi:MAG: NAD(P)-dependent glycerol-3-phosphate dehydrogenase, partial [Proteobacteria bacterium]|nr:NAD(P)-dependent glycerol-3-phosphate dehydrogenase [Pseudomonadota bacterium]
ITVIGSGSWGTALAICLASNRQSVCMWGNESQEIEDMAKQRCNARYLPGIAFPDSLSVQIDLAESLKGVRDVVIAVPSHVFRLVLKQMRPNLSLDARLLIATKGVEVETGLLMSQIAEQEMGHASSIAIISGPSFAKEVACGLPTAVVVASQDKALGSIWSHYFHSKYFRVYQSTDLIGVQLCSAVKNVLAIAVGISDGLQLGANARCALITRGLAEMTRLGLALGAQSETFMGLAGLGDLVLTTTDDQSRNRRMGLALGKNYSVEEATKQIGQVVEGIHNAISVYELAKKQNIEMPIVEQVYRVVRGEISSKDAAEVLLSRDPRSE